MLIKIHKIKSILGSLQFVKMQSVKNRNILFSTVFLNLCFLFALPLYAKNKISIVTSTSDLAYFAKQVGQNRVNVEYLVPGSMDPHYVSARPDFIIKASKADIFCYVGLDLEVGWLPAIWKQARNSKILPGGPGNCNASRGIHLLEKPSGKIDRSMGHMHAAGNPHYHPDPINALIAARNIRDSLIETDPEAKEIYNKNFNEFAQNLKAFTKNLINQYRDLRGLKVAVYHKEFSYLANRFGLHVAVSIEEKPGVPPSASYLARIVEQMKKENIKVILIAPYNNEKYAKYVASRTGAKVVFMPLSVDSVEGIDTYEKSVDTMLSRIQQTMMSIK